MPSSAIPVEPSGCPKRYAIANAAKNRSATIWIALIAMLTLVDPFTPWKAIHATAYEKMIAISAMKTGPGTPAFIIEGATLPTMYPIMTPMVATMTPG